MLAKVIVHAPTRREASLRLASVLETTRIQGLITNRDFLAGVLRNPDFLAGDTTTDFIERVDPPRIVAPARSEVVEAAIAIAMTAQADHREAAKVLRSMPSGWRNTLMPPESLSFQHGDEEVTVEYRIQRDGSFRTTVDDETCRVCIKSRVDHEISLEINDRRLAFTVTPNENHWITHGPAGQIELVELPRFPERDLGGVAGGLVAPMPGNVLAIYVSVGDEVEAGQLLLILEAMKMEHRIIAPMAGIVSELKVREGDQVANGELLIVLAEKEAS
jgi:propionyl-CoA carboxylase alpha chain